MGCKNNNGVVSHGGSKGLVENEIKESPFASMPKSPIQSSRPSSLVVKKAHTVIPAYIVAEAISTLHGLDLRWSRPITTTERVYVEQYVLAKYPQYAGQVEIENIDLSSLCINEESSEPVIDDKMKSPRTSLRESSLPFLGSNHPDLDRIQLEPSRLLDILTNKSSFPGSFISIPEIQARNKVLKHCGLPHEDYLVLFTPNYKDAMMLVGESYPFFKGNFYMSIIGEELDYVREFASYKESKVISAPETWLDLRIKGSQLSQYFRKKCKHNPKGLFSYPAECVTPCIGFRSSSELMARSARATGLVAGQDQLNLALHQPDFMLGSLENKHAQPSKITCLLVRKKSFETTSSSQISE